MTKRKPGRPTKHANGAMTTLRIRVPQAWLDWLDSKGNRSQAAREILRRAMDEESGAPNLSNECRECGEKGTGAGFCISCGGETS